METLFTPEGNDPVNSQFSADDTSSPAFNPHTNYVLAAIKAIKMQIDNDPCRYKTAAELMEQISGPHRNKVEKAFRHVYGARIKEYQVRQRLHKSKKLLEEGQPISIVAKKCLYGSQSAYSTAFKKEFGISPAKWTSNTRHD